MEVSRLRAARLRRRVCIVAAGCTAAFAASSILHGYLWNRPTRIRFDDLSMPERDVFALFAVSALITIATQIDRDFSFPWTRDIWGRIPLDTRRDWQLLAFSSLVAFVASFVALAAR